MNLGNLYKDYKHFPRAVESLKKAIELDETLPRAHYSLGLIAYFIHVLL